MKYINNRELNFVFFGGCILLILKLLFIDIDVPSWDITQYSPIDEYYYVSKAYNLYEFGDLFVEDKPLLFGEPLLSNFVTYLSLNVFGDNYLGLRFSSFLFGLLSYILIYRMLLKSKISLKSIAYTLIFMVINFSFWNASYIVEPTIMRIFSVLLNLYILQIWSESKTKYKGLLILTSLLIGLLFFFSYVTNVFVILASYILVISDVFLEKGKVVKEKIISRTVNSTLYFGIGILISFVIFYLFNKSLGLDLFDNTIERGDSYKSRIALDPVGVIKQMIFIIRSNIFTMNPAYLIVVVFAMLKINVKDILSWPKLKLASVVFLFTFVLQSCFINDFPERKQLMLFPFISIIIAFFLTNFGARKSITKISNKLLLTLLAVSAFQFVILYKYSIIHIVPWFILGLGYILIIFIKFAKIKTEFALNLFFIFILTPELINSVDHNIINRSYQYKDTFTSLNRYNGSDFIGGFSLGFRGYNNINTMVNPYMFYGNGDSYISKIKELSINGKKDFSIDYLMHSDSLKSAGFVPLELIMETEEKKQWYIYEEKIVK